MPIAPSVVGIAVARNRNTAVYGVARWPEEDTRPTPRSLTYSPNAGGRQVRAAPLSYPAFGADRPGHTSLMPTDRSGRRVLSFTMGLSAIFDLTGAAIFRVVRPNLPDPPPIGSRPDPLQSAMDTIKAAHRAGIERTRGQSRVA